MASRRAIMSVANKDGLVNLARSLATMGWEIVSTGGTARLLRSEGVEVKDISEITGFPEMLGGRVKTLHPAVHAGILARRTNPRDMEEVKSLGIAPVDMVVCNLYQFTETAGRPSATMDDIIEEIDIGGVTLLRAAAKNYESVTVVCDPKRYDAIVQELETNGDVSLDTRKLLALEVFNHTATYDSAIASFLGSKWGNWPLDFPEELTFGYRKALSLRYGENPHQKAAFYEPVTPGVAKFLSGGRGKGLSYNNINDADTAYRAVCELPAPACVIVKHASPCGVAIGASAVEAYEKALAADPVSAFGGVIAFNCQVDEPCAEALKNLFVEVLVAPGFSARAMDALRSRKNLRFITTGDLPAHAESYTVRPAMGGLLVQSQDSQLPRDENWRVVSKRVPTEEEMRDLEFAMTVCKHVRSNAIVFAKNCVTTGIGGGQPNRVDCVRIAVERGKEAVRGSVMASDAFFPFPDSVEVAAKAGITAIVHPGGSRNDDESLAVADAHGMAMVLSGARHFRH